MKQLLVYLCLTISLAGCNKYQVTVNERVISQPAPLLENFRVEDPALARCLEQTINDQLITNQVQLKQLDCAHSGIRSVEGLQQFSRLHTLNLGNNALTSIKPLLFLGELRRLNLKENQNLECGDLGYLRDELEVETLIPDHCQK